MYQWPAKGGGRPPGRHTGRSAAAAKKKKRYLQYISVMYGSLNQRLRGGAKRLNKFYRSGERFR